MMAVVPDPAGDEEGYRPSREGHVQAVRLIFWLALGASLMIIAVRAGWFPTGGRAAEVVGWLNLLWPTIAFVGVVLALLRPEPEAHSFSESIDRFRERTHNILFVVAYLTVIAVALFSFFSE